MAEAAVRATCPFLGRQLASRARLSVPSPSGGLSCFAERQEFDHGDLGCRDQDRRDAFHGDTPVAVSQPFGVGDPEMAVFRVARPFPEALEAPFFLQMRDDATALAVAGEGGIPLGRMGGLPRDARLPKKPVQRVRVRQTGCAEAEQDRDGHG